MHWKTHAKIIAGLSVLAIGAGAWYLSTDDVARLDIAKVMGPEPKITEARTELFPTINIAEVVGWKGDEKPTPAAGLAVNAFASDLDHPRWMHLLPNGDILVAESSAPERETQGLTDWIARKLIMNAGGGGKSANRITLLRDADGDGVAEFRSVLATAENGLNSPVGMQLVGETLYVANTDALIAFPFKPGDTKIAGKGQKIIDLPATLPNNHWVRNVIAAPDGKRLYVTVGSNSNIGENGMESEKNRAAILEVVPDKKAFRPYATGIRNPNGLAYEPKGGYLWMTVNERDMLGSDSPPDYLSTVDFGGFYGWPWYYWGGFTDKRTQTKRPDLQQYTKRPNYALGPHTASLGLDFAGTARLGSDFANGAFIGQHGSWNRTPPSGYKVIYVPFNERGFPTGAKPVDVLTGFLGKDGKARGRPAGVTVDRRGALLVADDAGNRIWRVSKAAPSIAGK
jgi:glucose/arabinose dehydrogenase